MVEGFNKTAGGALLNDPPPTELPSGNQIALLVWWGRLDFEGFARIGRVELSGEGEMVEGFNKTAGGALLNDPPPTELPSGDGMTLPVYINLAVFGLDR